MSQLRGYRTGGTIHVVVNNQVGFTTSPSDARTSVYATDVAKTIQAPIFHVNGDDPEAVVRVAQLAFEYRERFHRDVVIDLVCYRRRGHNEGDDPSMTQPLMTNLIEAKRSVRRLYTEALVGRGDITEEEYEQAKRDFQNRLEIAFAETHAAETGTTPIVAGRRPVEPAVGAPETTGVSARGRPADRRRVREQARGLHGAPEAAAAARQAPRHEPQRQHRLGLRRAARVRLAARRGHPGAPRRPGLAPRHVRAAPLGAARPRERPGVAAAGEPLREPGPLLGLRLAAQRVRGDGVRVRLLGRARPTRSCCGRRSSATSPTAPSRSSTSSSPSAEQKWGQQSSVVLLLPHGYEGQGPDHSSARIERYLQMCAQDNMTVARPSTPASYFHLLRRQAYARPRRPLIVFTPKAMLRLRGATSPVEDFTHGRVRAGARRRPRISTARPSSACCCTPARSTGICAAELDKNPNPEIALVRLEQYYPAPIDELNAVARLATRTPSWSGCRTSPRTRARGRSSRSRSSSTCGGRTIRRISRAAAASPATGSPKVHAREQADIMQRALTT